ncbi:unnamed protein product [Rodentolepis nana]|uniref:Protein Ycf2-like n=1 Tax=Rodentolepis nana TaxID=102285 RepID=A0A0R3TMI0_RODNA|nr:unnamed protein product [Rodentolepis nana]
MGNRVSTTHRFLRFTRHRGVRNDSPVGVEEPVKVGEETKHSTSNDEIGEVTNRMQQKTTNENPVEEKEVEAEIECREDTDSECSSSLREFLMLEKLCEEYEDLEQIKNRIEEENVSEKAIEKTVEETEIESRGDEDEDSECSSSLREFLMLERLCEEFEEAEERMRKRREQEKLEIGFKFRGGQLSTIEEEDEEEEEDSWMREIGEKYEHSEHFRKEEGKGTASGEGDHIHGEKLMSFEEFCGENFAVSPTFVEDMMEESRISQRRLEQAHEEFGKSLNFFLDIMRWQAS